MWLGGRGLCQNIYSREVLEEYRRRCAEAKGKAWSSGVIPEVFLDKVLGDDQHQSVLLPPRACLPAVLQVAASAHAIPPLRVLYCPCIACMHLWLLHAAEHSNAGGAVCTAVQQLGSHRLRSFILAL